MPHATATFNGKVIAETDTWEFVEGNVYVHISRVSGLHPQVLTRIKVPTQQRRPIGPLQSHFNHRLSMEGDSIILQHQRRR